MARRRRRRANKTGTVRKRCDKRWEGRYPIGKDATGKVKYRYFYGPTEKDVRTKIDKIIAERAAGLDVEKNYTLHEFANLFFEHISPDLSPASNESYRYTLKKILEYPDFQNRCLRDITTFDIELFLRSLSSTGYSRSTVSKCRGLLNSIFQACVANRLLNLNPVQYARRQRYREPVRRRDAFTEEEVEILFERLPKNIVGYSICFMIYTGLRPGEMNALRADCISEDFVVVKRAISFSKNASVGPVKSASSFRTIPLHPRIKEAAMFLRAVDTTYIWEGRIEGKPCNPTCFRKKIRETLQKLDGAVRILSPHSMRHTYASMLMAQNVPMHIIQELMGHADQKVLMNYIHTSDDAKREAVEKLPL